MKSKKRLTINNTIKFSDETTLRQFYDRDALENVRLSNIESIRRMS